MKKELTFNPLAANDEYTRIENLILLWSWTPTPKMTPRSSATHAPESGLALTNRQSPKKAHFIKNEWHLKCQASPHQYILFIKNLPKSSVDFEVIQKCTTIKQNIIQHFRTRAQKSFFESPTSLQI